MTAAQLKAVLKPLRSFPDDDVAAKLLLAEPFFEVARWGDLYLEGLANWVCHWLVLDDLPPTADDGFEVSESVGDTSFSLHSELVGRAADEQMLRTRYGQRYLQLANQVGMGGVVV